MLETILSIVGAFIGIGLALNAYFIKGLLDVMTEIKISTALNTQKNTITEVRVANLENGQGDLFKRIWQLEHKERKT